jgi:hypothetical protein
MINGEKTKRRGYYRPGMEPERRMNIEKIICPALPPAANSFHSRSPIKVISNYGP